jgi:hypothetical protein
VAAKGAFVEQVFFKVGELAASKESSSLNLPSSLGGAGGAMQLSVADDIRRTQTLKERKKGCC